MSDVESDDEEIDELLALREQLASLKAVLGDAYCQVRVHGTGLNCIERLFCVVYEFYDSAFEAYVALVSQPGRTDQPGLDRGTPSESIDTEAQYGASPDPSDQSENDAREAAISRHSGEAESKANMLSARDWRRGRVGLQIEK